MEYMENAECRSRVSTLVAATPGYDECESERAGKRMVRTYACNPCASIPALGEGKHRERERERGRGRIQAPRSQATRVLV